MKQNDGSLEKKTIQQKYKNYTIIFHAANKLCCKEFADQKISQSTEKPSEENNRSG